MKVTSVEVFDIQCEVPTWHPVIARVNTDEGISGLGEAGMAYGTGHSAAAGMVRNLAEAYVIGADPFKSEKLWETMFRATFWGTGGGPVVYGGISAIDIALWDIKGKALGVPIYQLLGGKTNDSLRTYASQLQFDWDHKVRRNLVKPEEYAESARKAIAEGYDAVKVDPLMVDRDGKASHMPRRGLLQPDQVAEYRNRVKAVRDAVGPNVDVIIELHSLLSPATAQQLANVWADLNPLYYEETVIAMQPELQNLVTRNIHVAMAAGERIYTRWGYRNYFEQNSLAVIQPDLCLVGGLSEGKKICDMANTYEITVQCHACGSPVSTAAALQLEATIPNFLIHEHHTNSLKPYNTELCKQDYQPERGQFAVPDLPGLGLELNDDVVKRSPCVRVP
jgi:galactonate dehydratase